MNARGRILVAGSYGISTRFLVDHAPTPGETVGATAVFLDHGGKGSNQAVCAARLGAHVTFLTAIGDDAAGRQARLLWEQEAVHAVPVVVTTESTMVGSICVDECGENSITIGWGAMAELSAADAGVVSSIVDESWVVVVQNEAPLGFTTEVLRLAAEQGALTILNPAPALLGVDASDPLWRFVDYLIPNEHEALALLGVADYSLVDEYAVAATLADATGTRVLITVGARGAIYSDGLQTRHISISPVVPVDTTGAGDSFTAAFAVALSEGWSDADAIDFAGVVAGLTVQHPGVIPGLPYRSEVGFVPSRGASNTLGSATPSALSPGAREQQGASYYG